MADITGFLFLRHLRANPTTHVRHLSNGKLVHDGPGQAFWFRPLTAALSEIPIDDREQPLLFHGRTLDFQDVTVQATVTYRVADPALAASRILVLTTYETDEYVAQALRAGASGFIGKGIGAEDLLAAVRTIAAGETLLSPAATRSLVGRFLATPHDVPAPGADVLAELTPREREMVALVATGLSNHEIAERMVLSPFTVRAHVQRAMTKLQARDRAQLVVIAYRSGLVQPLFLFAYMIKCVISLGPFDDEQAEAVAISHFGNERHTIDRVAALVPDPSAH